MVDANEISIVSNLGKTGEYVEIMDDRDRICQVLTNIIANAAKYAKKGNIEAERCDH